MQYPCPCCKFLTLSMPSPGSFEICPVCYWEDDDVQFNNPDLEGGANLESLNMARKNFRKFKASAKQYINGVRSPHPDEFPS